MGEGTENSLMQWKFPLQKGRATLALKPDNEIEDKLFKSNFFTGIKEFAYEKIWLFENEPVNIELIRKNHPEIELVFFDSTHSGIGSSPADLPTIMHYLME